jgi:hypothetical protein
MLVFFITLDTSLFEFVPALGGPKGAYRTPAGATPAPKLQMLSVSS